MSNVPAPDVPAKPAARLGIVHFLGWMIGVSAVLALYRAATAMSDRPPEVDLTQQLIQLGFGLAYGSAVSGLGLFLWRWWRGTGGGPSQPGHWLLVFGGIGMVVDFGLAVALQAIAILSRETTDYGILSFQVWSRHQIIGWSITALITVVILVLLRAAWWRRAVVILALLMAASNVAAMVLYVLGAHGVFAGSWPYEVSMWVRVGGALVCAVAIAFAEACDRRLGRKRDWLHLVGILTALALASVDLVVQGYFLWLARR
jgi:hypothetical protein